MPLKHLSAVQCIPGFLCRSVLNLVHVHNVLAPESRVTFSVNSEMNHALQCPKNLLTSNIYSKLSLYNHFHYVIETPVCSISIPGFICLSVLNFVSNLCRNVHGGSMFSGFRDDHFIANLKPPRYISIMGLQSVAIPQT